MACNRCWDLETRPKLRRDMCSIIRQMLRLILEGRLSLKRGRPPFQFQSEAPGFFKYLLEERGMKKLTAARYLRELNRLADYVKRVGVSSLNELSPQLLSSFVVETAAKFAPNIRCDLCGTIRGRRDYAILLMLVTYGLRAGEVAKLTLDDIDWKHERLQIPNRKAGNCTAYPLAGGRGGSIDRLSQERAPRN